MKIYLIGMMSTVHFLWTIKEQNSEKNIYNINFHFDDNVKLQYGGIIRINDWGFRPNNNVVIRRYRGN